MHRQSVRVLTAVVVVFLWFAGVAPAQYVPHQVKVTVPFDFTVGDRPFVAGDYLLLCSPRGIELRNAQGQVLSTVFHHSVESREMVASTKLVFTTEDGGHALQQVWLGGSTYGYELPPSKAATELAKLRSNKHVPAAGGGTK